MNVAVSFIDRERNRKTDGEREKESEERNSYMKENIDIFLRTRVLLSIHDLVTRS